VKCLTVTVLALAVASFFGCAQSNLESHSDPPALDFNFFRCQVQPVIAARCAFMACHGNAGRPLRLYAEQRYRLGISWDDYETPITDAELAANFKMVGGFVSTKSGEANLLSEKPLDTRTGGLFHRGKDLYGSDDVFLGVDDPGYRILTRFIAGERAPSDCVFVEEVGP